MKLRAAVAFSGLCTISAVAVFISTQANAYPPRMACERVYAACEAGDQSACDSNLYHLCLQYWPPGHAYTTAPFIRSSQAKP